MAALGQRGDALFEPRSSGTPLARPQEQGHAASPDLGHEAVCDVLSSCMDRVSASVAMVHASLRHTERNACKKLVYRRLFRAGA